MCQRKTVQFFLPYFCPIWSFANSCRLASSHMTATNLGRVKAFFFWDNWSQPMHLLLHLCHYEVTDSCVSLVLLWLTRERVHPPIQRMYGHVLYGYGICTHDLPLIQQTLFFCTTQEPSHVDKHRSILYAAGLLVYHGWTFAVCIPELIFSKCFILFRSAVV